MPEIQQTKQRQQQLNQMQDDRMMQMYQEDQRAIRQYQQGTGTFQISSGKSLARNYRDYEIYRKVSPQANAYRQYQPAAEYVLQMDHIVRDGSGQEPPDIAGTQLGLKDALLHLCSSTLLEKKLSCAMLKSLSEHLYAGHVSGSKEAQADPNAARYTQMYEQGKKCLADIYIRQLDAVDRKYGQKLAAMTPTEYLKALPQLEDDLNVIEDMDAFFKNMQMEELPLPAPQQTLMKDKLDYYVRTYQVLRARQQSYVDLLSGDLSEEDKQDDSSRLQACCREAKEKKAFERLRLDDRMKQDFFAKTEAQKQKALRLGAAYAKEEKELTERIVQQKKSLEQGELDDLTDDELASHIKIEDLQNRIRSMDQFIRSTTDDDFLDNYEKNLWLYEAAMYDINRLEMSGGNQDNALFRQFTEGYAGRMRARLRAIERYGISNHAEIDKKEYNRAATAGTVTQAYRGDIETSKMPLTFEQAGKFGLPGAEQPMVLADPFDPAVPEERRMDNWPQLFALTRACKKIEEVKQTDPNYYRFGQSYAGYHNCELLLKIKPQAELLLSLLLRLNHLDQMGNLKEDRIDFEELKQQFDEVRENYNYWVASKDQVRWQDSLQYSLGAGVMIQEQKCDFLDECGVSRDAQPSPEKLAFLGLPAKRLQLVKYMSAPGSDELNRNEQAGIMNRYDTNTATDLEKETARKELKEIELLERGEVTKESADAMTRCLLRFKASYETVLGDMKKGNYTNSALVEQQAGLEQCLLMSDFLLRCMENNGFADELKKQWQSQEAEAGHKVSLTLLDQVADQKKQLADLLCAARRLSLEHLSKAGDYEGSILILDEQQTISLTKKNLAEVARSYQLGTDNSIALEKLRKDKLAEDDPEQWRKNEAYEKVKSMVGQELIAGANLMQNPAERMDIGIVNRMFGKALQFVNWIFRKKRKDHGEKNYDACKERFEKKLGNVGSVLNDWQRGDEGLSPAIKLRNYYEDRFKVQLQANVRSVQEHPADYDLENEQFAKAIEAMGMYAGIEGIVNTDTTEMEMAFLDKFRKSACTYLENHSADHTPKVEMSRAWLQKRLSQIREQLSGTMDQTMTKEELEAIDKQTAAYVEDTTYSSNMEKSNIADIPLFTHTPNINDVRQGAVGDCWLASAISSVVNTNPEFIRSMFYDLGDGNVLVRLYETYDGDGKAINWSGNRKCASTKPKYFKLRKHYETGWGNAMDCTWVQLLEKAYALSAFNYHGDVRVSNGRLYNVIEELTAGEIDSGIAHLTGQIPESMTELSRKALETNYMKQGFVAGLSIDEEEPLKNAINDFLDIYGEGKEQEDTPVSLDMLYDYVKRQMGYESLYNTWLREKKIPEDTVLTDELKNQIADHYIGIMKANVERMRNGEKLQFHEDQWDYEESQDNHPYYTQYRQQVVNYFAETFSGYSQDESATIHWVKNVIQNAGTVSVAIPHAINIVDVTEYQGRYFFLMRDPFNVYNTEYTNGGAKQEGLSDVFWKRKKNRHLKDTPRDIVHGGFRGTSWVEAKDLCAMLQSDLYAVTKKMTVPPKELPVSKAMDDDLDDDLFA